MRILQINTVYGYGSTGRSVKETHNFLKKNGIESYVAYSDGETLDNAYVFDNKFDKKVHGLLSRITGLQGYFSRKETKKLLNYISEIKPDIVHLGNLHSNFINLPLLFDYLANNEITTVITLHDCWFYTGGHTHYTLDNYYAWQIGFESYQKNKKMLGNPSWFFDTSYKIFHDQVKWFSKIKNIAFIGVSEWITEEAKKSKVTKNAEVVRIYNWVDTDIFKPQENNVTREKYGLNDEFLILGVASTWSEKKGLSIFFELAETLNQDEKIVLVGNIDNKIELPKNVINISETNITEELSFLYSAADVFINLSIEETFGKVAAEAMACGVPVISNKYTANSEIIGENCGIVVNDTNIETIRAAYKTIKKNGKESYAPYCVEFVKKNFSMNKNLDEYLEIYQYLS